VREKSEAIQLKLKQFSERNRAEAKAEALRREKQIRSEVEHEARRAVRLREKELEVDRLRRKLAKKEDKERRPQLSSASHLVRAPTPTGVGLTEEELVAVLNREMERRRQEEEQRAVEARRIQQLETERLRCQSLESTGPCLEVPPTVVSVSSIDTGASGLWTHCLSRTESSTNIMTMAYSHSRHWQSRKLSMLTHRAARKEQPALAPRLQLFHMELQLRV